MVDDISANTIVVDDISGVNTLRINSTELRYAAGIGYNHYRTEMILDAPIPPVPLVPPYDVGTSCITFNSIGQIYTLYGGINGTGGGLDNNCMHLYSYNQVASVACLYTIFPPSVLNPIGLFDMTCDLHVDNFKLGHTVSIITATGYTSIASAIGGVAATIPFNASSFTVSVQCSATGSTYMLLYNESFSSSSVCACNIMSGIVTDIVNSTPCPYASVVLYLNVNYVILGLQTTQTTGTVDINVKIIN